MQYFGTGRLGTTQSVAYTGTAGTIASSVGTGTLKVRVVATTDCFIKIDKDPTATTSDALLPGLAAEYFTITAGQKVSAIQVTTGGTLYVTEIV
jgi:hypothetical protein